MTLLPGVYTVTAEATGYYSQTITDVEALTGTVVQNFGLQPVPPPTILTGQVSDTLTLAPIPGAEVSASGLLTTTNAGGFYTLTLPSPGWYSVTATAEGYISQTANVEALEGTVVQDFALEPVPCPLPTIQNVEVLTDDLTAHFSAEISTTLPLSYTWSFGDGAASSEPAPSHTYAAYGSYPFTLTVTNDCGPDTWVGSVFLAAPPQRIYLPVVSKGVP
jgi:hypothetical protein